MALKETDCNCFELILNLVPWGHLWVQWKKFCYHICNIVFVH